MQMKEEETRKKGRESWPIKIIETAGRTLEQTLVSTDPFDGNKCNDPKCLPSKNPENKISCWRNNCLLNSPNSLLSRPTQEWTETYTRNCRKVEDLPKGWIEPTVHILSFQQYLYLLPFSWSVMLGYPQPRRCQPPEVPEGTDAEQTLDVNEEEGEREVLWIVWYLEIMYIFSHDSIEKSLPYNLQEPNSRGEEHETPYVNEEDGEREVLWIDFVLIQGGFFTGLP